MVEARMLGYRHWCNAIVQRPYFFGSLVLTALLFVLLNRLTDWMWATQLLLAWNVSVWLYLLFTLQKLWRTNSKHILSRVQEQDLGKWIILVLVVLSLLMCVVAILVLLAHIPIEANFKLGHLLLAVCTVCSAWFSSTRCLPFTMHMIVIWPNIKVRSVVWSLLPYLSLCIPILFISAT